MKTLKEIAHMMGTNFMEAVNAAELTDSQEIGSMLKSIAEAYDLHMQKMADVRSDRMQIQAQMEKLALRLKESFEHETVAQGLYDTEMTTLLQRLESYRAAKAEGAGPKSDLTQPAKGNGAFADLRRS